MTSVNEMNAVTRDRARIRESIGTLKTFTKKIHSTVIGSPKYREEVWVRRGDVLALLTDNIMEPTKLPVKCGCGCGGEEPILPKTGRFHGQLEDGTPISIGYKVLEKDEAGDLKNVELLEVSLEKPGEKIPQKDWNLDRFIAKPIMLHTHDVGAYKPILQNESIGYIPEIDLSKTVPVQLPGNYVQRIVILDYTDGAVYVLPVPPGNMDIDEWLEKNLASKVSLGECEWMITSQPLNVLL